MRSRRSRGTGTSPGAQYAAPIYHRWMAHQGVQKDGRQGTLNPWGGAPRCGWHTKACVDGTPRCGWHTKACVDGPPR